MKTITVVEVAYHGGQTMETKVANISGYVIQHGREGIVGEVADVKGHIVHSDREFWWLKWTAVEGI